MRPSPQPPFWRHSNTHFEPGQEPCSPPPGHAPPSLRSREHALAGQRSWARTFRCANGPTRLGKLAGSSTKPPPQAWGRCACLDLPGPPAAGQKAASPGARACAAGPASARGNTPSHRTGCVGDRRRTRRNWANLLTWGLRATLTSTAAVGAARERTGLSRSRSQGSTNVCNGQILLRPDSGVHIGPVARTFVTGDWWGVYSALMYSVCPGWMMSLSSPLSAMMASTVVPYCMAME